MSTTYSVKQGDTFESIARKVYGNEQEASRVARANPGLKEPLTQNINITLPRLQDAAIDKSQQVEASNQDEVSVLIDGERFRYWTSIKMTRATDEIDTISFESAFEPDQASFRETFRPFSYKDLSVYTGGMLSFKGTLVDATPILSPRVQTVSASAYSRAGVLNDCTSPASAYPLEFNNQGLREIAQSLLEPFGLKAIFEADQGATFERVANDAGVSVWSFLVKLAQQRNLVIGNDENGDVVFYQSQDQAEPVANLVQGQSPLIQVLPTFYPQTYFSHITGIEPVIVGGGGAQFTVKNEKLAGVLRPTTFRTSDAHGGDVKQAVEAKMGRMFANMVSYQIKVNTWRDPQGKLWRPKTFIRLYAPKAMIYKPFLFEIRQIEFSRNDKETEAILKVVLPGAFKGEMPKEFPWDE